MSDLGEKIERFCEAVENAPPPSTLKVRRICYTGESVDPDAFDNLPAEREAAVWAVSRTVAGPCRASLIRYIAAIDKLLKAAPVSYDGLQLEHEDGWVYEYVAGQVPRRVKRVSTSAKDPK